MNDTPRRIGAIVRADVLSRYRRPSTLVTFVAYGFMVHLVFPVMVIGGRPLASDPFTIGVGTAMLAAVLVGTFGYAVVSNAIGADVTSRCGVVLASTPMRNVEYFAGRLLGNLVFLVSFTAGVMISVAVVAMMRTSEPAVLSVFIRQYGIVVTPVIVFVACVALVFEAAPRLTGRAGDVLYLVVWIAAVGTAAVALSADAIPGVSRYVDYSGLILAFEQIRAAQPLGQLDARPASPVTLPLLTLSSDWVLPRAAAVAAPLLLLAWPVARFHRFDPSRLAATAAPPHARVWSRASAALRQLTAPIVPSVPTWLSSSLAGAALADARMTLRSSPVLLLVAYVLAAAAALVPLPRVRALLLPIGFAASGVAIAEMSCRERRRGTTALVFLAPGLKARFVWWKWLGALAVMLPFVGVAIARLAVQQPAAALAAAVGLVLVTAAATTFGVLTSTPKAFVALFLTYLYIVIGTAGSVPALDVAGFYSAQPTAASLVYVLASLVMIVTSDIVHRRSERKA